VRAVRVSSSIPGCDQQSQAVQSERDEHKGSKTAGPLGPPQLEVLGRAEHWCWLEHAVLQSGALRDHVQEAGGFQGLSSKELWTTAQGFSFVLLRGWWVSLALDKAELVLNWQQGWPWLCWSWDGSWRVSRLPCLSRA